MRIRMFGAALVAGALIAVPATANAHVTVHPNAVPAGGYTVLDVNVPNEESAASTTKVEVQFPAGFSSVSTVPVAGWTVKVATTKLATPIKTDDGQIDTQVATVTWTADKGAGLPPGALVQLPISVKIPGKDGDVLAFKALQTYSNGEVVRWIGAAGSDKPAARIAVTAADHAIADYPAGPPGVAAHSHGGASDHESEAEGTSTTERVSANPVSTVSDHDDGNTLSIVALLVGAFGLLAALFAVVSVRRSRS